MKILVTGANGYLGAGIVKQLLDDGYDVIATDIRTDYIDKRATCISGNIFEIEEPNVFFHNPDVLLHLAWRDGFVHNSLKHFEDLPKHYDFIRKMIAGGIKKTAVMGSMHEIGFYEGCISENTPCHPMSLYGIAKNALRDAVEMLTNQKGVRFQWLRGYYIVGNNFNGSSIFSKIALAANEGKKTFPFTTGINQYDFVDYEDFCYQVASAVEQEKILGIINICSGKPEKLADRVERFIKENNYNITLEYGRFPDRPYDSKAVWGNGEKIRKIIENRNIK